LRSVVEQFDVTGRSLVREEIQTAVVLPDAQDIAEWKTQHLAQDDPAYTYPKGVTTPTAAEHQMVAAVFKP